MRLASDPTYFEAAHGGTPTPCTFPRGALLSPCAVCGGRLVVTTLLAANAISLLNLLMLDCGNRQ